MPSQCFGTHKPHTREQQVAFQCTGHRLRARSPAVVLSAPTPVTSTSMDDCKDDDSGGKSAVTAGAPLPSATANLHGTDAADDVALLSAGGINGSTVGAVLVAPVPSAVSSQKSSLFQVLPPRLAKLPPVAAPKHLADITERAYSPVPEWVSSKHARTLYIGSAPVRSADPPKSVVSSILSQAHTKYIAPGGRVRMGSNNIPLKLSEHRLASVATLLRSRDSSGAAAGAAEHPPRIGGQLAASPPHSNALTIEAAVSDYMLPARGEAVVPTGSARTRLSARNLDSLPTVAPAATSVKDEAPDCLGSAWKHTVLLILQLLADKTSDFLGRYVCHSCAHPRGDATGDRLEICARISGDGIQCALRAATCKISHTGTA